MFEMNYFINLFYLTNMFKKKCKLYFKKDSIRFYFFFFGKWTIHSFVQKIIAFCSGSSKNIF